MNYTISESLLSRFSEFVAAQIGMHFPRQRWSDLQRGIRAALKDFGFQDEEACMQWLMSSPLTKKQAEILASHITVGETYFFREKKSIEILERNILPELISSRREREKRLRIWSAGCASGEEPYSLAILLKKMVPNLEEWNITILATDINPRFLRKASTGVYSEWSFRDTPQWVKARYFKKLKENSFEILPSIKKMVAFSYQNLVEDNYPSLLNSTNAMDIIFCRNVLMYFDQEYQKKVIQNLYRCLMDGGWLIVSPSEMSHILFSQFSTVKFPGALLYRKETEETSGQGSVFRDRQSEIADYEAVINQRVTTSPDSGITEAEIEYTTGYPVCEISPPASDHRPPTPDLYEEALALYEQGSYGETAERLLTTVSGGKENPKAMALLTRAYANQGKLSEAFDWCEKTVAVDKLNPGYHYLMATILLEQGRTEDAVVSLKRTLYLDQDFIPAYFALGNICQREGKFKESARHFENALVLLRAYRKQEVLPESDGITAGRMIAIIHSALYTEKQA